MFLRFREQQNAAAHRKSKLPAEPAASAPAHQRLSDSATRSDNTKPLQLRPVRRERFPARGNATEPTLRIASHWEKQNSSECSSPAPFIVIQQTTEFVNLFGRGLASGQRMHHELTRRTFEHLLQHVPGKLALGLLRGK